MSNLYRQIERVFENLVSIITSILGNSITFIIALITVIFWFSNIEFYTEGIHKSIGDIILGVTFLSLFVIQKTFNRFSAALHIKVNELVASHEPASNSLINIEEKSEHELTQLSKEYADLAAEAKEANKEQD